MNYGKDLLELFNIDRDIIFLNNGSFGATPLKVLEYQSVYKKNMEKNPLEFFLEISPKAISESREKLAKLIKVNCENICFVDNATTGVNSVLNFLINQIKINGKILYTNHTYPAVINTLKYYEKYFGIELLQLEIPYPTDKQQIFDIIQNTDLKGVKIALIDSISSATSLVFPFNELSTFFKSIGIITLVDGAHGVGCLDLNFEDANFDFFTSNCHKWLFSPKGSAFLYVSDRFKNEIHPQTISLFYNSGLIREFEWQGTKDTTSWIAVSSAIDFYFEMGAGKIIEYNNNLIINAKEIISESNGTLVADNLINACMSTFLLDIEPDFTTQNTTINLRKFFLKKYNIELPFMIFDNKIWFRITAQLFNQISDYQYLTLCLVDFKSNYKLYKKDIL